MLANNAIYLVAEKKEIKDIILFDSLKGSVNGSCLHNATCAQLTFTHVQLQ